MVSASPDGLSEALLSLSQMLLTEEPLVSTLERVAQICLRSLPSCDSVGVTLLTDGTPSTAACTDPGALKLDQAQYSSGRGPCLASYEKRVSHRIEDMASDDRWPEFAAAAQEHGISSSFSLPLIADGRATGALNLYSRSRAGYEEEERQLAELLGSQAAVAITNAEVYWRTYLLTEQLRVAIESRDVIGQAKGILMATRGISADEAFGVLRRASQSANTKLRSIADEVALTGELPDQGATGDGTSADPSS
jgi:GAF domain-containing protein